MTTRIRAAVLALTLAFAGTAAAAEEAPATPATKLAALNTMCTETAEARVARHEATPLHDRLGGDEKIEAFITEVVRLHAVNPDFAEMMQTIDQERLIRHVTDFVIAGTGGEAAYGGRGLREAHAPLDLDDADFLSAGGDIVQAMHTMGYGQEEIDEFLCILLSLKDQVVFR